MRQKHALGMTLLKQRAWLQVMTVGLKTVREVCLRCPLVMDEALLSDLVLYRKERDKHVRNSAKALTGLFRELKPSMLEKKERGRGADLALELAAYGASDMRRRCAPASAVVSSPFFRNLLSRAMDSLL